MTATISTLNHPAAFEAQPPRLDTAKTAAPLTQPPPIPLTTFGIATTHQQIKDCWQLVHHCYTHKGLIDYNPYGLHTTRQAINPNTVVVYGKTNGRIDSTLTVIPDSPHHGLPLDEVYPRLLNQLRNQGRKLVEVGLLADNRTVTAPGYSQTFGTMHRGFYRALHAAADIVIGVHPDHANFYIRMMGLEVIGQMSTHPKVKNRPVVPLLLDMARFRIEPLPRLMRHFKENPISPDVFDARFRFSQRSMNRSSILQFLDYRDNQEKLRHFSDRAIAPIRQVATV